MALSIQRLRNHVGWLKAYAQCKEEGRKVTLLHPCWDLMRQKGLL